MAYIAHYAVDVFTPARPHKAAVVLTPVLNEHFPVRQTDVMCTHFRCVPASQPLNSNQHSATEGIPHITRLILEHFFKTNRQ